MFEFEGVRSTFFERVEVTLCSLWDDSWCGQSGPKLVYRNSETVSEFEVRMRKLSIYLKSEHMVYPLSIASCHLRGWRVRCRCSIFNIGRISIALCSIGVIHDVVQVIQNCYMGNPNSTRSSRLVRCYHVCIRWERMDLSLECLLLSFLGDVRGRGGSFTFFWEGRGDPM